MEVTSNAASLEPPKDIMEFENTKAGVKGLVDLGLTKIPKFFVHPPEILAQMKPDPAVAGVEFPLIDLEGCDGPRRKAVVEEIREASETWGFFRIVNHSVPQDIAEGVLQSFRGFHEQPAELKREYYSRDGSKKVRYFSNGNLLSCDVANWRDTVMVESQEGVVDDEALLPQICRKEVCSYLNQIVKVRKCLLGLLSEALGLNRNHLESLECSGSEILLGHYFPSCPEPELTFGSGSHTDPMFITIILHDDCTGLQVHHQAHWLDVSPIKGALTVNIGDMMQLITNDKFKSRAHRVLATRKPRVSVVCFCRPKAKNMSLPFGPIKDLLSETNPPIYRSIGAIDYHVLHKQMQLVRGFSLQHLKITDS